MRALIILLLTGSIAFAQSGQLRIQLPPFSTPGAAWTATLIYSGEATEAYMVYQLKQGTQILQKTSSRPFMLEPGQQSVDLSFLPAFSNGNGIWQQNGEGGPVEVCLEVYSLPKYRLLGSQCQEKPRIQQIPPHLVYPFDGDELLSPLPVFSWTPPAPLAAGQEVHYQLMMVEVPKYQSPQTAIQSAPAFFKQEELTQNMLPYSYAYPAFEAHKTYAWQIKAYSQGQYLGQSEVWSFELSSPGVEEAPKPVNGFAIMRQKLNPGYYPARGAVHFRFDRNYGEDIPRFKIYDDRHRGVSVSPDRLNAYGDNCYRIDLPPGSGLQENQYYFLEVPNAKGEILRLKFKYFYPTGK